MKPWCSTVRSPKPGSSCWVSSSWTAPRWKRRSPPRASWAAPAAATARAEETDWPQIERLYLALEKLQPSPVVTLNRAVAVAKVRGPGEALALIEPLGRQLSTYFHFFGVRGAFLMQLGGVEEARVAFDRAIALAHTAAEAAHIRMQIDRLLGQHLGVEGGHRAGG